MLLRHTLLFLPAQLLPALCQFAALIAWSHLATAEVIGIVTLFTSIQEFLNIAFLGFWNQYVARYTTLFANQPDKMSGFRTATTAIVSASIVFQIVIGVVIYALAIDRSLSIAMVAALAGLIGGRALNLFQAERARAQQDVVGYTLAVTAGPVFGFLIGLFLLWKLGSSAFVVFVGFAIAQVAGMMFNLARDRSWLEFGRLDLSLVRHAIAYGGPLILSTVFNWVTQNASRIAVSYMLGLAAAGVYSVGLGLGYRAATVAAMMVTAAAFPIAVRLANSGNVEAARQQLANNGILLMGLLVPSMTGLALLSHDVLQLFMSKKLDGPVEQVMLWSLLAGGLICIRQHFLNQFFLIGSNTRPIAIIATGEAVVATLLAIVIVPWWGLVGGAVALALTSAVSLVVTFFWSGQAGRIIPGKAIARVMLAAGIMALALAGTPAASTVTMLLSRIVVGGGAYLVALALMNRAQVVGAVSARLRRRPTLS